MRTTRIYDAAGNSLVENAIQRIRNVAATLMESLTESTGLRFSSQHPFWTWARRHGAWLLNRFQPSQGLTSYELCQGRTYEGKLCEYGEICFAYSKPRWKVGICLGKTEIQDAWVIGDGNRVFLSRSLRRISNSNKKYLACYQNLTAYSWDFQQNFGGRIVPSKRLAAMVTGPMGVPMPVSKAIASHDEDALEGSLRRRKTWWLRRRGQLAPQEMMRKRD